MLSSTAGSSAGRSDGRILGVNYWRIFPHANGNGPLYDGVTYRAVSGLNGLLHYVDGASLDEK